MKTNRIILQLGLVSLLAVGFTAPAAETSASPSLSALKSVPLAELPGKAAALVAAADAKNQLATTADVVKSAVGLNPAAAPAIVGSIAAGTPTAAATAAATAASVLPKQATVIAQAAAAAAPKQAGKIVEAVCRVVPDAYKEVAQSVAAAVPTAAREILAGVALAVPQLQDAINHALAIYKGAAPSVNSVLAQAAVVSAPSLVTLAAGSPSSPISVTPHVSQGGYYAPRSGSPVNLDPGSGTPVTGSENYSAPPPP